MENKNVYINSIEACDVYDHMFKDKKINMKNYIGMIPYSMELLRLEKEGFKIYRDKNDKRISNDIINLKFTTNVKSARKQIPDMEKSLQYHKDKLKKDQDALLETNKRKRGKIKNRIDKTLKEIDNINHQLSLMKNHINDDTMKDMKSDELRLFLYQNGLKINGTIYMPYKRSSAKSRKGEMTFIKKSLHKKMLNWSRMGINFKKPKAIDYPSLLAYESLVMSSILQDESGLLNIPTDKMLLISDVESVFNQEVNSVHLNDDTGYLDSSAVNTEISSDLFDGESMLDSKYFTDNPSKGMKLLRSHFFKSCAFNTNIQQFMKDHYKGNDFDNWIIYDMFNNPIKAKDVEFIFTPSSLKALKFSNLIGDDNDMYQYWKSVINQEYYNFGVCKQEAPSSRGYDEYGNILQQASYQFINSLPIKDEDIPKLMSIEEDTIYKLKNDDDFFINYLRQNANVTNSNDMLADIYKYNKNIVYADIFKKLRKKTVNSYVNYIKRGKIRMNGDYTVMGGNLYEYLLHSIGKLPIDENGAVSKEYDPLLKDNEIHTTLFNHGDELTSWRNPHTSQSNVLVCHNVIHKYINRYFNLSDNIVVVNAIDFPIQFILSGADYDSDTIAIVKNDTILKAAKKCYGNYNVSVNNVDTDKKKFKANYKNMAIIDNDLSKSTMWIGKVVNENQHVLSLYWDFLSKGASSEDLKLLNQQIDKFTILSEIAIDLAKKKVNINVDKEINHIKTLIDYKVDDKNNKLFPIFFSKIKQNNNIKVKFHNTIMDNVVKYLSNIQEANTRNVISIESIMNHKNINNRNINWYQRNMVIDIVDKLMDKVGKINTSTLNKDEKYKKLDDEIDKCRHKILKMKINESTMHSLLYNITNQDNKIKLKLMKMLYDYDSKMFINGFI